MGIRVMSFVTIWLVTTVSQANFIEVSPAPGIALDQQEAQAAMLSSAGPQWLLASGQTHHDPSIMVIIGQAEGLAMQLSTSTGLSAPASAPSRSQAPVSAEAASLRSLHAPSARAVLAATASLVAAPR